MIGLVVVESRKYTSVLEEIISSITHGLGLVFCLVGIVWLFLQNDPFYDTLRLVGVSIFGIAVFLVYTFSTLYHSLYYTGANAVFKRLDHSGIFLLIAGTYTPFILISLKNPTGLLLLSALWVVTILGIVYKAIFVSRFRKLELITFIILGWIGLALLGPILSSFSPKVIFALFLGGWFYTFGTIFYSWEELRFNHGIWHLFVLGGTISHFLALSYI